MRFPKYRHVGGRPVESGPVSLGGGSFGHPDGPHRIRAASVGTRRQGSTFSCLLLRRSPSLRPASQSPHPNCTLPRSTAAPRAPPASRFPVLRKTSPSFEHLSLFRRPFWLEVELRTRVIRGGPEDGAWCVPDAGGRSSRPSLAAARAVADHAIDDL